jgi:hypothetical protein
MRRILAVAFVAVALSAPPALAWNKAGHMVTGAIAYQVLKDENEKTIPKVIALLEKHPDFAKWQKQADILKLTADEREMHYFMKAARWADDARDNPAYYPPDAHNDRLHYINYPYKPDGQPDTVKTAPPDEINIVRGFTDKLRMATSKGEDADRAVALTWVFHLVGDVHQPLHVTALFTTEYPQGDRGGNLIYIRAKEGTAPINLHKYWDDLILGSENFQAVRNTATELRNRKDIAKDKLTELKATDFEQWAAKESFELAKKVVYRDGKLQGATQRDMAPVLPADYAKTVQPVAERRAVLAGYRLAALLQKQFE